MDAPYSAHGFAFGLGGDEMVMPDGRTVPVPTPQNGHRVEALDHVTQNHAEDLLDGRAAEFPEVPDMALAGSSEIFSATDEPLRPEPFGRRDATGRRQGDVRGPGAFASPETETEGGHTVSSPEPSAVENLLSTVRSYAETLTAQARADADELLSRAHAQAELLRVRADAVRAEAECMRAEAAALRIAVREDAEAARERAKSAAETHAAAEELRAAMQREADAAREEFERMRTEAMVIRRLLRAEVDAGVFDTERTRADVQRLWAETDKLAAAIRRISAHAGVTSGPVETGIGTGTWAETERRGTSPEDVLPLAPPHANGRATGVVGERRQQPADISDATQHSAAPSQIHDRTVAGEPPSETARALEQSVSAPFRGQVPLDDNVAELLREIREVVSAGSAREHRSTEEPIPSPGFDGPPVPAPADPSPAGEASPTPGPVAREREAKPTSQPLIGSGGWQQKRSPDRQAIPDDAPSSPPASSGRRRRFRRE